MQVGVIGLDLRSHEAQADLMNGDEHLLALSADVTSIAAVGATAMGAQVPSCPEWRVADLIRHVGTFHRYVTYLAGLPDGGRAEQEGWESAVAAAQAVESDDELASWFQQGGVALVDALGVASPTATIESFYGVHQPDLLVRRVATETTIHRWDAQGVTGTPHPIDTHLADDGISEFLDLLMPMFFKYDEFGGAGETIRLEPIDVDERAWVITVGADSTSWERQIDVGVRDAVVRGSASDLYLWFLGRRTADAVLVDGDAAMLKKWRAAIAF